jgi:hypothetical protein
LAGKENEIGFVKFTFRRMRLGMVEAASPMTQSSVGSVLVGPAANRSEGREDERVEPAVSSSPSTYHNSISNKVLQEWSSTSSWIYEVVDLQRHWLSGCDLKAMAKCEQLSRSDIAQSREWRG